MDLSGSHFEYAGISSRAYGLILANIDTTRNDMISGSISLNTFYGKSEDRTYYVKDDRNDSAITFDAEVITDDESYIPLTNQREIEKWLFSKRKYSRLYKDETDDCEGDSSEIVHGVKRRTYMNCRLINATKIENNAGVVGYKFTVQTDSSLAWQEETFVSFDINSEETTNTENITIDVDTDYSGYTYPTVEVTMSSAGGNLQIANVTDMPASQRSLSFEGLLPNETITIKCGDVKHVSGSQNFEKITKMDFVRLLDGDNTLSITGAVSNIKVSWQNKRYI